MGLFTHKKQPKQDSSDKPTDEDQRHFFDEYYREELRNHGRWHFEEIIRENGQLFKQDLDKAVVEVSKNLQEHLIKQLDETIGQVNTELKEHVTRQLDERFMQYDQAIKDAQASALQSLDRSVNALQEQHEQLSNNLKDNLSSQEAKMAQLSEENTGQIAKIKDAQDSALKSLDSSVRALEEQHEQLADTLKKNLASQEERLVNVFEDNMAHIIEHYLLGALGDKYDIKAQLPAIIQQMEDNKQAIVDDMKL